MTPAVKRMRLLAALAIALAIFGAAPARAQPAAEATGAAATREALTARQSALFDLMLDAPTDLELMFEYAAASMRLEDYEAAIATLERMLIFEPDLPRVKLELGVAYFRLGSYAVARFYFEEALAGGAPAAVAARVAPFLDAIAQRTRRDRVSGFVAAGPIYSTNATLGPTDREIRSEFFPGGVATLDETAVGRADAGGRLVALLSWSRDLQGAAEADWLTTALYSGLRYRREDAGEFDAVEITTGPNLSLAARAFGPRARPFAQAGFVRAAGAPLYVQGGGGVEYTDTLSRETSVFATISGQYRDFGREQIGFDGVYGLATAGAVHALSPATSLRGAVLAQTDRTQEDYRANTEFGVRLTLQHEFAAPGFVAETFPEVGPWRASLFAQGSLRLFDAPDPAVDADLARRDRDSRLGLRLLAPLDRKVAVAVDASWFRRSSNIPNYELDNVEIGFSIIRSF
ncbi:tetratricopeptide repeat protein [Rubrimonas cliftonensis]|uniref:Tetratricopeptide repeat-containing protein n=1 Tax=Rubrimonas cliftonensis TaxID=89524 RepID=A0A1H3Z8S0_9RHOB|nr:tetratricopeptide repeat protein [Rubrimonas cliftonensis]SEA20077.1 Tetratricopeptide repeat-containing protein [Rubrimonas cliftonensis]